MPKQELELEELGYSIQTDKSAVNMRANSFPFGKPYCGNSSS